MFQTTFYVRPEPYYAPEVTVGTPEMCNLHLAQSPLEPPKEREWTIEEILAREG